MKGYYFITDCLLSRAGNAADVKAAVAAGVEAIQYRNKCARSKTLYEEALSLKKLCRGAQFIVNDRVDIALAVDAAGVHLGQEDMPPGAARRLLGTRRIIGVTVHDEAQARRAQRLGADYLGVSPVFPTRTKPDAGEAQGVALIRRIRKCVRIPVVAIGGITLVNAPLVIAAGADALCAISAVVTKADVKAEIRKFQALFNK